MKPQNAVAMCLPHRRDDLPAYARTGQLHSGHPEAEVQSRCMDLLYAVHGADHDEHEDFNQYLEDTGHPMATGQLQPQQAQRVAAMARKYQERQDQDTSDCAELLLNAAGIMLEHVVITARYSGAIVLASGIAVRYRTIVTEAAVHRLPVDAVSLKLIGHLP